MFELPGDEMTQTARVTMTSMRPSSCGEIAQFLLSWVGSQSAAGYK